MIIAAPRRRATQNTMSFILGSKTIRFINEAAFVIVSLRAFFVKMIHTTQNKHKAAVLGYLDGFFGQQSPLYHSDTDYNWGKKVAQQQRPNGTVTERMLNALTEIEYIALEGRKGRQRVVRNTQNLSIEQFVGSHFFQGFRAILTHDGSRHPSRNMDAIAQYHDGIVAARDYQKRIEQNVLPVLFPHESDKKGKV